MSPVALPSRRKLLAAGVAATVAGALVRRDARAGSALAQPTPKPIEGDRVLRLAHPTDIHVLPSLNAPEGMAAAFTHMMALADPPQLIINGGDCPMDSASTPYAESKVEWDLFKKILADNLPATLPLYHTLGNHDVFGRDRVKSNSTGTEPHYGRRWFLDNFGYSRTYQSFDRAGWHFVILDSIDWNPGSNAKDFVARIPGEQLEWLKADLAANTKPAVVISHVPILSVANFFDGDTWHPTDETMELRSSRMHTDCRELEALFRSAGNVKLCLSGHLHLHDRCEYNGITYICDGSVSSNKWKGVRRETPNGYGLIDLYADGRFKHHYQTFGWKT